MISFSSSQSFPNLCVLLMLQRLSLISSFLLQPRFSSSILPNSFVILFAGMCHACSKPPSIQPALACPAWLHHVNSSLFFFYLHLCLMPPGWASPIAGLCNVPPSSCQTTNEITSCRSKLSCFVNPLDTILNPKALLCIFSVTSLDKASPLGEGQLKHKSGITFGYPSVIVVKMTPLSFIPGAKITKYLGIINMFFIRETTSLREVRGNISHVFYQLQLCLFI